MNEFHAFGAAARAELEKEAAPNLGAMAKSLGNYATNRVLPAAKNLASKAVEKAAPVVNKATTAAKPYVDDLANRATGAAKAVAGNPTVQGVASRVGNAANRVATGVGTIGQLAQDATRGGLNMADDVARYAMNGPGSAAAAGGKFGDKVVRGVQTEAGRAFGTSPVGDKLNPLNLAAGGGAIYGAGKATGLLGSGSADVADPTPNNLQEQQHRSYDMQKQMQTNTGGNNSQGLMGMWNSLPIEARYAIGAGVPLALAGAVMGGRGNTGAGLGMGALGLGAAGLGAAGAGMFGDGARRMVGQGANALYGMVGGQSDPMSQMRTLGKLSPEFGTTALMGRDPNLSSEQARGMYDFMTQNQEAIERLMPQLQNSSVTSAPAIKAGAYFAEKLAGRCWTGYEPVPGKKPYSNDSCRPVGSKKKKKSEKKAASPFGPAQPITGARPTMTQMPPKPAEKPVAKRDVSKLPPYVSQGQQAAEQAAKQPPMNTMVKTQAAKKFAGVAGQGKTTMNATPSSRGDKKLIDDKQRETNSPVPTDAKNTTQEAGLTAAEKQAFGAALGRAIGTGAKGLVRGAGRAAFNVAEGAANALADGANYVGKNVLKMQPSLPSGVQQAAKKAPTLADPPGWNAPYNPNIRYADSAAGKAFAAGSAAQPAQSMGQKIVGGVNAAAQGAAAAGRGVGAAVNAGANIVKGVAPLAQGVVGGVGAAAQGLGTGVNVAGKALSAASKSPLTAIPTAAAGLYGASQLGGMMPGSMPKFQSPITWENNNNGVKPLQSGRINQPL
jgi:hypothetical protein